MRCLLAFILAILLNAPAPAEDKPAPSASGTEVFVESEGPFPDGAAPAGGDAGRVSLYYRYHSPYGQNGMLALFLVGILAFIFAVLAFVLLWVENGQLSMGSAWRRVAWRPFRLSTLLFAMAVLCGSLTLVRVMPANSGLEIAGNFLVAVPFVACLRWLLVLALRDLISRGAEDDTRRLRKLRGRLDESAEVARDSTGTIETDRFPLCSTPTEPGPFHS